MGTSKPHIKLKLDNNANDTPITPKENEQPEINGKTESANSSLKKMEENATENNNAAKQEEMKQADTVEQPKKQIKLSDYLEIISKLLGILTILGTITGGFFIYKYLENIGQLSILPEIITNPSVFIVATIIFGSILLLFLILVSIFYFIGVKLHNASPSSKLIIKFIIFIIEFFVLILNCYLLYYLYIKNNYDYHKMLFINNLSFIINSCFLLLLLGLGKNQNREKKKITKYHYILYRCVYFIPILVILSFFLYYKTLIFESIHFIRFAETPENSSWYLLHNNFQQNNGFQETNGINKSDLKKLKKYFTKPKQCSKLDPRENALYGYMAWNLGDTKVFCPPTVDNTKADFTKTNECSKTPNECPKTQEQEEAEKLTKECIVISGKALQIMPTLYVSTEPIQQPKYDVKEPTIEINCCNCNPNSPKNKDGHPDIGYTDKKICQ